MPKASHGHMKEIEFHQNNKVFILEIDAEDKDNLVIVSVTHIDGEKPEHDVDPETFQEELDIDDWQRIKELLK